MHHAYRDSIRKKGYCKLICNFKKLLSIVPFVLVVRVLGVCAVVWYLWEVEVTEEVVHRLVQRVDRGLQGIAVASGTEIIERRYLWSPFESPLYQSCSEGAGRERGRIRSRCLGRISL